MADRPTGIVTFLFTDIEGSTTRWEHHREAMQHAVLDAYGWPHDLADDDILTRLLALNLERAARQGTGALAAVGEQLGIEVE